MLALLAAAALVQAAPQSGDGLSRADSLVVARTLAVERRFLDEWGAAWRASERTRAATIKVNPELGAFARVNPRNADLYCTYSWETNLALVSDLAWGVDPMRRKIGSHVNSRHFVCPNWLPPGDLYVGNDNPPGDERAGIDGALTVEERLKIVPQRRVLIAQLEVATRQVPASPILIGQLVRLTVDDGNLARALQATKSCIASPWWCHALAGYVHQRASRIVEAEREFDQSLALMPPVTRCAWNDLSTVLDGTTRSWYTRPACAKRDSVTDVIWWLADPLWSVDGNDRRAEQFARHVLIELHAATDRDERYNWTGQGGGDALAEMVLRYGWPGYTYAGYAPPAVIFGVPPLPHWGYVILYKPKPKGPPINAKEFVDRTLGGIKTTFEYPVGRLHLVPEWSMISDPFAAHLDDWNVNGPGGGGDATYKWWPHEHYAPPHPLIAILDQQTAALRREDCAWYAWATNLGQTDLARRVGDSVDASFMVSTGPADIARAAAHREESHSRLTFLAPVPSGPVMLSAEVGWDSAGHRGARARFGATVPPALSAMKRGDADISEPVLLVVPPDVTELPNDADGAVGLMRGSTTLSAGTNAIGVYWETYGFSATDSVDVTVSVQRHSGNVIGRVANAVGIGTDPNAQVSSSWKEPQPGHTARTIAGAVPIQMRSVILQLGTIPPGEYSLQIEVKKPGGASVTSRRSFTLR
ncbi:MAG TPA: hypothetical protein VE967_10540 [Gemmatimonadaceae bacterium]|nr:hypothetical protein [Gemmatimonadaceae bacterium]